MTAKMAVDLLDFLTTGSLGPLRLALDRPTIVQLLGDPDGTLVTSRIVETIRYGNLQLQLKNERLVLISLDFASPPPGSKQVFEYVPWAPTSSLSKDAFELSTAAQHITFSVDDATTYGSFVTLFVSQSGTRVTFSEGQLESIYVSASS
jgi:hypothetical protein